MSVHAGAGASDEAREAGAARAGRQAGRGVTQFDPSQAANQEAATDEVIAYAKEVKDWPTFSRP